MTPTPTPTLVVFDKIFKDLADRHKMINDYGFGPSYNIGLGRAIQYPFLWVEPVNSTVVMGEPGTGYLTEVYQFYLIVMDKINKGDDNYIQTSSDADYILKTLLAQLDQQVDFVDYDLSVYQDVISEPVYEQTEDYSNGWQMTLNIKVPMRFSPCNNPF